MGRTMENLKYVEDIIIIIHYEILWTIRKISVIPLSECQANANWDVDTVRGKDFPENTRVWAIRCHGLSTF